VSTNERPLEWYKRLHMEERMDEIIFVVEDAPEGGYTAQAVGAAIFTEGDSMEMLRDAVRDAVQCHFEPGEGPRLIRLHYVRDEVFAA
jgi:hypothetical protein